MGGGDISNREEMELPDGEWEHLARLLHEAYPMPEKGKIAGNVMAQIRTEKNRKQKWRSRMRRYGSVAACLVLLGGALLLVYPHLQNTVDGYTVMDTEAAVTMGTEMAETYAVSGDMAMKEAEEDVEVYSDEGTDMAAAYAMPRMSTPTETVEEKTEEEAVQTYSATSLLKSVSMYAEADANADAADDSSLADGFLHYLLNEGYLTMESYQDWLTQRDVQTVWEPEELCEAFGLESSLYDAWLRK